MLELEKTYLIKYLPADFAQAPTKEVIDIYYPISAKHAVLRLRKSGSEYEMTKKTDTGADKSQKLETTIPLDQAEYEAIAQAPGKKVRKIRYYYPYEGLTAEVDVFQDELAGLIEVDFEFETATELKKFAMPDFCLVEVTDEDFLAGGMLCGKSYRDIEKELGRLKYKKIV
ncbi:MAG: CYTH domain-containing protein [Candidatus Paceibacterota bacterium]|jgi:CYTH domain-containing protein